MIYSGEKLGGGAAAIGGFSLVELMVTLTLLSILTAIGLPGYNQYAHRSKIADATSNLSDLRMVMEQNKQDTRTYLDGGGACDAVVPVSDYFTYACAATANTFIWTATNKANEGLGNVGQFRYSIDQDGKQKTTTYAGTTYGTPKNCWMTKPGSC